MSGQITRRLKNSPPFREIDHLGLPFLHWDRIASI